MRNQKPLLNKINMKQAQMIESLNNKCIDFDYTEIHIDIMYNLFDLLIYEFFIQMHFILISISIH